MANKCNKMTRLTPQCSHKFTDQHTTSSSPSSQNDKLCSYE